MIKGFRHFIYLFIFTPHINISNGYLISSAILAREEGVLMIFFLFVNIFFFLYHRVLFLYIKFQSFPPFSQYMFRISWNIWCILLTVVRKIFNTYDVIVKVIILFVWVSELH